MRKKLVYLALIVALSAGAVHPAAADRSDRARSWSFEEPSWLLVVWEWLIEPFVPGAVEPVDVGTPGDTDPGLPGPTAKDDQGCGIDPNGKPIPCKP
jgi:hypothetical protein